MEWCRTMMEGSGAPHCSTPQLYRAKRAGDYYMFDCDPNDPEVSDLGHGPDSIVPEVTPGADKQAGPTPLELIAAAVETDMDLDEAQRRAAKKSDSQSDLTTDVLPPPCVDEEEDDTPPVPGKLASILGFIRRLVVSFLDWMTAFFNRRSRDHRYVAFVLSQEKRKIKAKLVENMSNSMSTSAGSSQRGNKSIREYRDELLKGEEAEGILHDVKTDEDIEKLATEAEDYWRNSNAFLRWLVALGCLLLSHTELVCYLVMFFNHAKTAAMLSLPLPLFALLWGTLSSPRPSKFFWIVVIAYTEGLVVVKFLFQFKFFEWSGATGSGAADPFWPPRIIGIERQSQYAAWDVALLICLFFHRYMMRKLGLWKDAQHVGVTTELEDSETDARLEIAANGDIIEKSGDEAGIELQAMGPNQTLASEPEPTVPSGDSPGPKAYLGSCGAFYHRLLNPSFRYIQDMYPFLFLADLLCFLICTFGYSSFGLQAGSGNVLSDVQTNRVPLPWVLMLIFLFLLIVIDRGLYLRKAVLLKLVFQHILIVVVHVYIFFVLPSFSERSVQHNLVAQLFYIVKCVYFLFSAWQIRNGYPSQVIGNLLTKSYNIVSFVLFSVFFAVPFLFEIRSLIDWIWTDTSMPLFDFFTMENFYAIIYKLKCGRKLEADFPAPRGEAKGAIVKYAMGGGILFVIILLIFLPLLLYSLVNLIGEQYLPETVTFTVTISGYPALYSMTSQRDWLGEPTPDTWSKVTGSFAKNRRAAEFVNEYGRKDTQLVDFRNASLVTWDISDPSLKALQKDLRSCETSKTDMVKMYLTLDWHLERKQQGGKAGVLHTFSHSIRMTSALCGNLSEVLDEANKDTYRITIPHSYPPYLLLPSEGSAVFPKQLLNDGVKDEKSAYRPLVLYRGPNATYWNAGPGFNGTKVCATHTDCPVFQKEDENKCCERDIQIFLFVDKLFPSLLNSVVKGGIIAMYVVVVLVAANAIRNVFVGAPLDVIIKEMPNVDRLLKICLDIYLVREARDFVLEQDIYAKLLFLFRSPETLIKWTRPLPEKAKED